MTVLDVGCGPGAITADIANTIAPDGYAVGVDRDESLLELARRDRAGASNVRFVQGDVLSLDLGEQFDIVTSARTLQWVNDPSRAIDRLRHHAKPGGRVVILDYNHEDNAWTPEPPESFRIFYRAFLEWRSARQWDNRMADQLPQLFADNGLADITVHVNDEVSRRGEAEFAAAATIWVDVIQKLGAEIVKAGFISEMDVPRAEASYRDFVREGLEEQRLSLRTIEGRVP